MPSPVLSGGLTKAASMRPSRKAAASTVEGLSSSDISTSGQAVLKLRNAAVTRGLKEADSVKPTRTCPTSPRAARLAISTALRTSARIRILADVRSAVEIARRAALGEVGHVRVGFTESASFNPRVTAAFRNFRTACPEVEMSLEESPSTVLAAALREGRIDAAFVRPPLRTGEGIELHLIDEEEMVVAVPSSHPLAQRADLEMRDLA